MTIACISWGSLVWDPRELPRRSDWFGDGPQVSVDYFRRSLDGRLTLVLSEGVEPCPSLWCELDCNDVIEAANALAMREGMPSTKNVGVWSLGNRNPSGIFDISVWAHARQIEHVVWTDLRPKFNGLDSPPTPQQAVDYLRSLPDKVAQRAAEYVRRTPKQIRTPLRQVFESELGWTAD